MPNWIFDVDELYATRWYVFTLRGGAEPWRPSKQVILMRSTLKAELTAFDTASAAAEWLCELLLDLPVVEKPIMTIFNCEF